MVSYSSQVVAGPVLATMVAKDKGSFSNRVDCAAEQVKNDISSTAEAAATVGAGYLGYKGIKNIPNNKALKNFNASINNQLTKDIAILNNISGRAEAASNGSKILDVAGGKIKFSPKTAALKTGAKITNTISSILNKLSKTTGKQKLYGALAALIFGGLMNVSSKNAYHSGQIDQLYTDKAKLEDVL